jgi:murein peptide amidase A
LPTAIPSTVARSSCTCARAGDLRILLFGAIHGDEPLGVPRLELLLARALASLAARDLDRVAADPDGLAAGTKDNRRGIDLNRNFPARNWNPSTRPATIPVRGQSRSPNRRALAALIARVRPTRIIAPHSPFRTVNYDGTARPLAERMAARNG